jgi:hypothetical protein
MNQSFPGKCSEPRPRGDSCKVTSLATPPGTGAESIFKDFPGDLNQADRSWDHLSLDSSYDHDDSQRRQEQPDGDYNSGGDPVGRLALTHG